MNTRLRLMLAIAAAGVGLFSQETAAPRVLRLDLQDAAITPVTERFVVKAIRDAEAQGMKAVVLVLDTPGGLVDSTRGIVKSILASPVPIVVYVAPGGARAASAGTFITMAAHVAAMAPGTTIGAAHPVAVGGLPGVPSEPPAKENEKAPAERTSSPMEQKVLNDTVSWARALAELRGRNAEWMAKAVKDSASVAASEALREGVIDLMAPDVASLLQQVHGREVVAGGKPVKLETASAAVTAVEMWWGEQFLAALANPTIAFLLLIFGIYGVIFELYTPGWGVPGTVGLVCLMLGFFSLAILPTNMAGLALMVLALGMLAAEIFVTSYGLLTLGGVICLVTGGLLLVDSPEGFMRVSLSALVPVAGAIAVISAFLMTGVARTQRLPGSMLEASTGTVANAAEEFRSVPGGFEGFVRFHGELWKAVSPIPVGPGQPVRIIRRSGLLLEVTPATEQTVVEIGGSKRRQTA